MGGRQKQRERRRQQRESAAARTEENQVEASLDAEAEESIAFFMQMAIDAGMRVVDRSVVQRVWTTMWETAQRDEICDVGAIVLAAMREARVKNCDEEAEKFSSAISEFLASNDASVQECEAVGVESTQFQEPSEEVVMFSKHGKRRGKTQAPGRKASQVAGRQARGQVPSETLGMELSKLRKRPKPRTASEVDEIVWSAARYKAEEEMKSEFGITQTFEEYYQKMTDVGKALLAQEIQRKTQRIYDYKATKIFQRTELKNKSA